MRKSRPLTRGIFSNFQYCARCKKYSKDNKHNSLHLARKRCWDISPWTLSVPQLRFSEQIIGSLSKPRRRRQRERRQAKGLMNKTIAVHVRYKSLHISFPSFAKWREVTKFCVVYVYGTWTRTGNFSYFQFELNAVVAYLA